MLKKLQLKNGLNLILMESHRAPVVSVQMWVRTGSADEKKGEEGISHFIEHLVFKGTDKYKVGEIASIVEGSGGELNAYTSFDQTVFYVTISKAFEDVALDVISQMMGFPTFDKFEVDNEREVVIEEIKRGQDSPGRAASQLMFSTAFKKHPYGTPVIGYEKVIKNISVKKIKDYFYSRYLPQNMFLIVSGDFESKQMTQKINQYFGGFKKLPLKKVKRTAEPKQTKPQVKVEKTKFPENTCYITWKIPSISHKDIGALDLFSMAIGMGDNSKLVKKLRIDEPLVKSIGASTFTTGDQSLFVIYFDCENQNYDKVLKTILDTLIQSLQTDQAASINNEDLTRIMTMTESDQFYSLETVDGLARQMGHFNFYFNDPNYYPKYLKELKKNNTQTILKTVKKYLNSKTLCLTAITKENDQARVKQLKQWSKDFDKMVLELSLSQTKRKQVKSKISKKIITPKYDKINFDLNKIKPNIAQTEKIALPNGTTLLLRQSLDTPVVSARVGFLGGVRGEGQKPEGLSELFARTWVSGTSQYNEEQIAQITEGSASSIGATGGRNTISLSLETLKPFEKKLGQLFVDVLTDSTWPTDIVDREKTIQLQQIKQKVENPSHLAVSQFMKAMFVDHPYSRDLLGTEGQFDNILQSDITSYWKKIGVSQNANIIVTGNFDKAIWKDFAQQISQKLPKGKKPDQSFELKKLSRDEFLYKELKREQSHIIVGYRGVSLSSQERYALHIIESILSGQGGRLFLELRDKNSLAYSVSPIRLEGLEGGYFGGYIACAPDKTKKSIEMMQAEFQKLCQDKVSEDELTRAKRYLIGRHDIDLQKSRSIGASILFDDIYGIDYNETFNVSQIYNKVTADDVMRVAQHIFNQNKVISVVGVSSPF